MSSASFTASSISNNSSYVSSESSLNYVSSESTSSPRSEDYDFNYTVTRQKIYSYNDYTKILIILFIVLFAIYLMVVYNKFN